MLNQESIEKKKVLIVTSIHPDFDKRVWRHVRSLARSTHYKVYLICPWNVGEREEREGVTLYPFRKVYKRWQRPFLIPLRVLEKMLPLLKKSHLIHFHDLDLLPIMAMISIVKPVVYDVHENYAHEMLVKQWISPIFRKLIYYVVLNVQRLFSSIICNVVLVAPSQDVEFKSQRIRKVYIKNYASLDLLENVKDDYMIRSDAIVFIGEQHENNGSLLLIDIAEKLKDVCPNMRIIVADMFSDPEFKKKVFDDISERRICNIDFVPRVVPHKIMDILNRATIALNPNLRVPQQVNGIHTKMFEFMAAGLPIVASDLPHQVEIMGKSKAGILAQPEDTESFVCAIQSLIKDRVLAMELGRNGQNAFKKYYSWETQMSALMDFYERILSGRE